MEEQKDVIEEILAEHTDEEWERETDFEVSPVVPIEGYKPLKRLSFEDILQMHCGHLFEDKDVEE